MRYKEQVMNQVEKAENLVRSIETLINRNETRETVLDALKILKERIEQIRSQVSVEPDDFFNSK